MEFLHQVADIFLHLDKNLAIVAAEYGTLTYAILFAIIFCETGLVITPFLPGDSLLFAAGVLAAAGNMDVGFLILLLIVAAVLGDFVNYQVGRYLGNRVFANPNSRIFKKEYLERTERFYNKYGGKTIVLARFVPIVRTFAPLLAGVGHMPYGRFALYNWTGGVLWITSMTLAGYYFSHIEIVRKNFSIVVLAIVFISILPLLIEVLRARREAKLAAS
jgi:membrane-associated protein